MGAVIDVEITRVSLPPSYTGAYEASHTVLLGDDPYKRVTHQSTMTHITSCSILARIRITVVDIFTTVVACPTFLTSTGVRCQVILRKPQVIK